MQVTLECSKARARFDIPIPIALGKAGVEVYGYMDRRRQGADAISEVVLEDESASEEVSGMGGAGRGNKGLDTHSGSDSDSGSSTIVD